MGVRSAREPRPLPSRAYVRRSGTVSRPCRLCIRVGVASFARSGHERNGAVLKTAVKICGVTRVADALAAARAGAHAIGLVFYRPSPRYLEPEAAAAIVRALPPFVTPVGLFVDADEEEVRAIAARARVQMLQFHGAESPEFCSRFDLPYMKALRVRPG